MLFQPWVAKPAYRQLRDAGALAPQAAYIVAVAALLRALPVLLAVSAVGAGLTAAGVKPIGVALLLAPVAVVVAWVVGAFALGWTAAACSLTEQGRRFSGGYGSVRFWRYVKAVLLRRDVTAATGQPPAPRFSGAEHPAPVEPLTARQWEKQLEDLKATQRDLDASRPR